MTERLIHRLADRPNRAIAEALESLALAELLDPGRQLMIVSPWISDFPIIDNRASSFSALEPSWGAGKVTFSDFARSLLRRGSRVLVGCGDDQGAIQFIERLRAGSRQDGTEESLTIKVLPIGSQQFIEHEKALIADSWAIYGSMNLTFRGIEVNGELVTISSDQSKLAELSTAMRELFR